MNGKMIVLEGTDFSGKHTQLELLKEELNRRGLTFGTVEFPNYGSEASFCLRQYLSGVYGDKAADVSPKEVSVLFAVDRYHSYKTEGWGKLYRDGKHIIADRYISSNAICQAAKIATWDERKAYIDWLYNLECNDMGLPKEDLVIYLDMPVARMLELREKRMQEPNRNGETKDIHESDIDYLVDVSVLAHQMADKFGWHRICCVDNGGKLKTPAQIQDEVLFAVLRAW